MTQVLPATRPAPVTVIQPDLARAERRVSFQHLRALLVLNALYFGVAALAAGYAFFNPAVQSELTQVVVDAFSPSGGLGPLIQAYLSGALLMAIALTFLVNLIFGSFVFLTLPSAFIPFAGIVLGLYRAVLWGVLFAPTEASPLSPALWFHLPTILLEGEAYIVAMLGVWLWWHAVLTRPGARWSAWRQGLVLQARVYLAVVALLAVSAIYEAIEVIWILPTMAPV